jgi:F-box protein 18 (helicase)
MQLTEQQQAIIQTDVSTGEILAVRALAGTGKTSTLVEYAKQYPHKKMLYLAYNKSVATEAKTRFPRNVECRTTHSLAWPMGNKYQKAGKLKDVKVLDIVEHILEGDSSISSRHRYVFARAVLEAVKAFIYSDESSLSVVCVKDDSVDDVFKIVSYAKTLWERMLDVYDSDIPMSFDGYLKAYQLSNPRLRYDVILLDEAQDANPCTLAILKQQLSRAALVLVGDPFQQIYSFRGSVNAFEEIQPTYIRDMTRSWRFGQQLADYVNPVLNKILKCGMVMEVPEQASTGINYTRNPLLHKDSTGNYPTILTRTNGMSVNIACSAYEAGLSFGFLGGFNKDFKFLCIAVAQLIRGKEVKHPLIKRFKSYGNLVDYIDHAHDHELASVTSFVKKYMSKLSEILDRLEYESVDFKVADVKLLTIHKSKGLEFDRMYIASDLILPEFDSSYSTCTLEGNSEEYNVLYVALTRARKELYLPKVFQDFSESLSQSSHKLSVRYR